MNKEIVKIEVSTPPYAEALKSWHFLVNKGHTVGSWSDGYWFPKSLCKLDSEAGTLLVPIWLLKKNRIEDLVTYVD
tara:strand:+ start:1395 stop:1622 length:228 start_codon:yes stop_codon:yes gene_type:complete